MGYLHAVLLGIAVSNRYKKKFRPFKKINFAPFSPNPKLPIRFFAFKWFLDGDILHNENFSSLHRSLESYAIIMCTTDGGRV